ncbi:MAG: type II toxin-antitoxin system VapC family toxin [Bifidobacteriaceae bacterium]|jgi:PIN domain nuclease of toxin-antitoxin system|nr:type II toxin-antitoxin system VapC family toxin [Bifidobacteriaceae bacterium]
MRLLLDSNVLIRSAQGSTPTEAARLVADPDNQPYYSAAALWEITIKVDSGKLALPVSPWELEVGLSSAGYKALDIKVPHVRQLSNLKDLHKDPFDRIMVAQAIVERMTFLTTDALLGRYSPLVKLV